MATNSTTASIRDFLAPGKRVQINFWPEAAMASVRDRVALGTIVAVNEVGVLLDGERHPSQPQGISWIPFTSIATIDTAEQPETAAPEA